MKATRSVNEHLKMPSGFKFQAYHHEAVELRYAGTPHAEIARLLTEKYKRDFKPSTVRAWFSRGQPLDQPYYDFARQENDRRRQAMREEAKKLVSVIPERFEKLLKHRYVRDKEGNIVHGDDGKPLERLDIVTVAALKELIKLLKLDEKAGEDEDDPTDRYFDKLETETETADGHETDPAPK